MSHSFTQQLGNSLTNSARGRVYALLLGFTIAVCVMMFVPDNVINLRMQESLWPIIGILAFVCGLIMVQVDIPTGIFGIFCIVMALIRFTPDSYAFLLLAMFYLTLYYVVVINRKFFLKHKELIYNLICIFALINVYWLWMQASGQYVIFKPTDIRQAETGWFANRNEVSAFLAMSTPLFFRGKWHWGIIPMIAGLVMAKCTNGAITATFITGIYLIYITLKYDYKFVWKPKILSPLVVGIALAVILIIGGYMKYVHKGGYEARIEAFKASTVLILDKPFFGWGIGQSPYIVPLWMNAEKQDVRINAYLYKNVYHQQDFRSLYIAKHDFKNKLTVMWTHLHNECLQWMIDAGIAGLLFFLLALLSHAWGFIKTKDRDICAGLSVLAALITANAFFTFQIGRLLFVAVLMLAIIKAEELNTALIEKERNKGRV